MKLYTHDLGWHDDPAGDQDVERITEPEAISVLENERQAERQSEMRAENAVTGFDVYDYLQ